MRWYGSLFTGLWARLFLVLLSLYGIGYWLLATTSGLRFAMRLAAELAPGELHYAAIDGRIVHAIQIKGVLYRNADLEIAVQSAELAWQGASLPQRRLRVGPVHVRGVTVRQLRQPPPKARSQPVQIPVIAAPWPIELDDVRVEELAFYPYGATVPQHLDHVSLDATLRGDQIDLRRFDLATPTAALNLRGGVQLAAALPVDLVVDWRVRLPDGKTLVGGGPITGQLSKLQIDQALRQPLAAQLAVTLTDGAGEHPTWQARLAWPTRNLAELDAGLPPLDMGGTLLASGDLARAMLRGGLTLRTQQNLDLTARLEADIEFAGRAVLQTAVVENARGPGRLILQGEIEQPSAPHGRLSGSWEQLGGAAFGMGDWRSEQGKFSVQGNASAAEFSLQATVMGKPVQAEGQFKRETAEAVRANLQMNGPGADVHVSGVAGQRLDLTWRVRIDDLAALVPGVRGDLNTRGTARGEATFPDLEAHLQSRQLHAAQLDLTGLRAELSAHNRGDALKASLQIDRVRYQNYAAAVTFEGNGSVAQHHMRLALRAQERRLSVEAAGGWRSPQWRGQIQQLTLMDPQVGAWRQREPAALQVTAEQALLDPLCLVRERAAICASGAGGKTGPWRGALQVDQLPLAWLRPWLPPELETDMIGMVDADVSGRGTEPLSGRLRLALTPGRLVWRGEEQPINLQIERAEFRGDLADRRLNGNLALVAACGFRLNSEAELPVNWRERTVRTGLNGTATISVPDLHRCAQLAGVDSPLRGQLSGQLRMTGDVMAPDVRGAVRLTAATLPAPQFGIDLTGLNAELQALGRRLQFTARGLSGGGTLRVEGGWRWADGEQTPIMLRVSGQNFLAMDLPDKRVRVTPDLQVEVQPQTQVVMLNGEVTVPKANVLLGGPPGAVQPSPDVVVVGGGRGTEKKKTAWRILADLRLRLGDQVAISGLGFHGRLTGGIRLAQRANQPPLGTGEIRVIDGKYSLYGTELPITEGRAVFANSPLTQPVIYIRSERTVDTVTVALNASGAATAPKVQLSSTMPMNQTDILSMLLTGKSISQLGQGEGDPLVRAAETAGLAGGSLLAKKLGSALGLGTLTVDSRGGFDRTAVQLGRQITPRVFIQYGVGLFDASQIVRVRYRIGKHWLIQSETGTQSGGDILYEYEK